MPEHELRNVRAAEDSAYNSGEGDTAAILADPEGWLREYLEVMRDEHETLFHQVFQHELRQKRDEHLRSKSWLGGFVFRWLLDDPYQRFLQTEEQ